MEHQNNIFTLTCFHVSQRVDVAGLKMHQHTVFLLTVNLSVMVEKQLKLRSATIRSLMVAYVNGKVLISTSEWLITKKGSILIAAMCAICPHICRRRSSGTEEVLSGCSKTAPYTNQ